MRSILHKVWTEARLLMDEFIERVRTMTGR
jgi:hypothetical protein